MKNNLIVYTIEHGKDRHYKQNVLCSLLAISTHDHLFDKNGAPGHFPPLVFPRSLLNTIYQQIINSESLRKQKPFIEFGDTNCVLSQIALFVNVFQRRRISTQYDIHSQATLLTNTLFTRLSSVNARMFTTLEGTRCFIVYQYSLMIL